MSFAGTLPVVTGPVDIGLISLFAAGGVPGFAANGSARLFRMAIKSTHGSLNGVVQGPEAKGRAGEPAAGSYSISIREMGAAQGR
jgi:hypothetical protein